MTLPVSLNVAIALDIPVNSPTNACITRPTGPKNLTNNLPKFAIEPIRPLISRK